MCSITSRDFTTRPGVIRRLATSVLYSSKKLKKLRPVSTEPAAAQVAYDVLKTIYLERGYRVRDIPRLILEKNLFGLNIDDRAA